MSGLIDPARKLTAITPAASPTVTAGTTKTFRAVWAEDDCTAKVLFADGTNATIPLLKGPNPIQVAGVFSSPAPGVSLWGVE